MTMNAELFRRADILFQAACALPPDDRIPFVDEACVGDPVLRRQVINLLRHDNAPAVDFESAIDTTLRAVSDELLRKPDRPVPVRIGSYQILRQIGEGGFGSVYLGRQENPRRTVAIKVVRSFMTSPEALRRFEHEIHILGRLQHPGIAQIFEAGVAEAVFRSSESRAAPVRVPYYTMEHIDGPNLIDYATNPDGDGKPLDLHGRLDLVARVCDALQNAHQNGFIHRDLKPDNILVASPGAPSKSGSSTSRHAFGAQPKLLDFGVARALSDEDELGEIPGFKTRIGQMIGTPAYMSPEQMRGDPMRVDTRADVYAVGVILYQLLAGRLPYDIGRGSLDDAARIIERANPPSLRSGPTTQAGRIDTDVEAIVFKALAKDRDRRYQSAADLASDLRRYLAGEPIEAKRDSALYLLRKNARRYRGALSAVALISLMLVGFTAWSVRQARISDALASDAEVARKIAERERDRASATSERLAREISLSNIGRGRAVSQAGNHIAAEKLIWSEYLKTPSSRAARWALMEHYSRYGNSASLPTEVGTVLDVALSPDESRIAVVGEAAVVELWDAASNSCIARMEGHTNSIHEACFSPDGQLLATAGGDGDVILWDLVRRIESRRILVSDQPVNSAVFDPTGRYLVTCGDDGVVRVHDLQSMACVAASEPHPGRVMCARVSADGRFLASGSMDWKVRLWRFDEIVRKAASHQDFDVQPVTFPNPRILTGLRDGVRELEFNHCGDRLAGATGSRDRRIILWNTQEVAEPKVISPPAGMPTALAFSPDDETLHVGGWFSIESYNVADGTRTRQIKTDRCTALRLTRDGSRLVGVSRQDVRIWELTDHPGLLALEGPPTRSIAFHPNGCLVATGHGYSEIRLHDLDSGRLLRTISIPAELTPKMRRIPTLRTIAFDRTGDRVAALVAGGRVPVWNSMNGDLVADFRGGSGEMHQCIAFDPIANQVGMAQQDSSFALQDLAIPDGRTVVPAGGKQSLAIAYSPHGDLIATTSRRNAVCLWHRDGRAAGVLKTHQEPWGIAFSPDGERLAAGTWGNVIELWNLRSMTRERILEGHSATVWSVAFKPDEPDLLASGSSDGTVRIWDVTTGENLAAFEPGGGETIDVVAFSPDGSRLGAVCGSARARILDLASLETCIVHNEPFFRERLSASIAH